MYATGTTMQSLGDYYSTQNYPGYDTAYQQQLSQYAQLQAAAFPQLLQAAAPATTNVAQPARNECAEFAWLRGRIKEIIWKK
jgi:hypothetical protein